MLNGHFYTVFTMGFATATGLFAIIAAAVSLRFPELSIWASQFVTASGRPATTPAPEWFAAFIAISGLTISYWLVKVQQFVAGRAADREIAKLNGEYRALVQTVGEERANEIMQERALAWLNGDNAHFDLFGRSELLHSMRVAGLLPRNAAANM